MEILRLGAELFMRTDRQTDTTELIFANRRSADAPKKYFTSFYHTSVQGPVTIQGTYIMDGSISRFSDNSLRSVRHWGSLRRESMYGSLPCNS